MAQADITFQAESSHPCGRFSSSDKDDVYISRKPFWQIEKCYRSIINGTTTYHLTQGMSITVLYTKYSSGYNQLGDFGGKETEIRRGVVGTHKLLLPQSLLLFFFFFPYFTSEKNSSLMTAQVLGSLLVIGTIMLFHIPASLAPEHHLCTEAVEESESSLQLRLPCVYFDLGHVAPRLGSGFYKGQS